MEQMAMVEGRTSPRFAAVREAFARSFAEGLEHGAAVSVVLDGEPVVDLWGGHRTLERSPGHGLPWQADTLVNVWSVTKGVVALAVAMLVERGQLDYTQPLARYWPEFAAGGKEAITLEQVLSHQAGLDGLRVALTHEDLYARQPVVEALAAMAPLWPPGSRCVYHPMTYGFLLGELVRRVDGRSLGQFIAQEISQPLGLSFYLGLPLAQEPRVAELSADDKAYDWVRVGAQSAYPHAFQKPGLDALWANTRAWRAAEIPGANGHADARSLARLFGVLACGGSGEGVSLISAAALARATATRFDGLDACYQAPTVYGAGFRKAASSFGPQTSAAHFGHSGWGGSVAFADPQHRLGFAFVSKRMLGFDDGQDPRRDRVLAALYAAL